jgi:hypothetical protein
MTQATVATSEAGLIGTKRKTTMENRKNCMIAEDLTQQQQEAIRKGMGFKKFAVIAVEAGCAAGRAQVRRNTLRGKEGCRGSQREGGRESGRRAPQG